MHLQFKLAIDKIDSLNNPDLLPEEIDVYLSDAQEQFIVQRAYGNNQKRETLEETQKRVKDLQSLTKNAEIIPLTSAPENKPNGVFVELPLDYRYAINEEVLAGYTDCNNTASTSRIKVLALTHDKYNDTIDNPFAKPNLNKVYRLPFGRFGSREHFELVSSTGVNITKYYLRYLKNPTKIDLAQRLTPVGLPGSAQGDLSDESYREVIRIAVRNAAGDLEDPNVQEKLQRLNEQD